MKNFVQTYAWRVAVGLIISLLVGCGATRRQWEEGRQYANSEVSPLHPLAKTTAQTLREDFSNEPQGGAPIAIGLALSGGGTRAAMFACCKA